MPTPRNSTRPGTRTRLATSEASRPADRGAPTMRMRSPSCPSTPSHTGRRPDSTAGPIRFGPGRGDPHLTSVRGPPYIRAAALRTADHTFSERDARAMANVDAAAIATSDEERLAQLGNKQE